MAKATISTETGAALPASGAGRFQGAVGPSSIVLPLGLAFLVLAVWQLYVVIWRVPAVILPSPISITEYIVAHYDILLMHAVPTTVESAAGFLLAVVLGIAIAIVITYSDMAREALYPNLVFFQLIPKIALAPLFIIWIGTNVTSKVAISMLIALFAVVIDTVLGLRSVDSDTLDMARSMRASPLKILWRIRFPAAMPHIFSGMKVAISLALVGAIAGEFVASQVGLGYVILTAQGMFQITRVFAAIVLLGVFGTILFYLIVFAERLIIPWHISHRTTTGSDH